jgi:hypothetical protein
MKADNDRPDLDKRDARIAREHRQRRQKPHGVKTESNDLE